MATSMRDRAANRAKLRRQEIAAEQAAGNYPAALHVARGWLMSEVAKIRRQRPADADAIEAEVTERLASLAEALPGYRPRQRGAGHGAP